MNRELKNYVEIQAEKAENLSFCSGIKLLHIRNSVEELLSFIGRGGIFEEYTLHSIAHIDEMLKIVEWLIPDETKKVLTQAEWLMLTLAVYFHDLGMVVTKDEYAKRNSTSFKAYKEKLLNEQKYVEYKEYVTSGIDEHFLYQEFVRENHARRIKLWIEGKEDINFGDASSVRNEINNILSNLDNMFKTDLAMICESHHKDDIDNFSRYKVSVLYGNDDNERVNLNYIAIILRIADLLHITRDRTPSISRKIINVTNPVSVIEWEKQKAVRAVKAKQKRNAEDNIDPTLEKDTIEVTAYFDGAETAEAYFGLSAYLQYTKKELEKCNDIVAKAQKSEGTFDYKFPCKNIDESQIIAVGFETTKLQFTIAQDNILQLLVGHTLYNDSSVVVRELVQNGLDAVTLQKCIDKQRDVEETKGEIQVCWDEKKRELSFWDNGTGMTIQDVEKYLLKVGASKYRDESIKKNFPNFNSISHFGIGILTCFMVANDIDITTNSDEQELASVINLRKVNGSYLSRKINKTDLDKRIQKHGTMVKLYIRSDVDMTNLEKDLRKWIVLPEVPVILHEEGKKPIQIGYDSLKDILVKYLNETGRTVDGEKFDVTEQTHGNVTIAYAIRHLKYLSDWCLMSIDKRRTTSKSILPIGTCVEGIRVEFTTPGYKNSSILAIANIKNSKYQTNVARSAIELDPNKEILSDIYDTFAEYIQGQMDRLEQKNYSKSWAISEGGYLMNPLVYDEYGNSRIEPMDEEILVQRLAKLKCIVLENDGKREVVSATEVAEKPEINILECKMTQAAEYLLKEIRSDATLKNLIGVVCSEENFLANIENVICNYSERNILHRYALRDKEVSKIAVNRKQRRIHVTFKTKENFWDVFALRNRGEERDLFIPKKEFDIEGLEDEIGVKTIGGIYLKSNTVFCQYVKKIIKEFREEDTEEGQLLLEVFLSNVFDSDMLEIVYKENVNADKMFKQMLTERFVRVNEDLLNNMWSKVDMEEFAKVVLTKNYSLYSINNWSRKEEDL